MVDQQLLGRVLKEAMKGGKYLLGTKEVVADMKTLKVVVASDHFEERLTEEAAKNNVPLVRIEKSSTQLGRMLGRQYRVSALGLRTISERDLTQLLSSSSSTTKATAGKR